MIELFIRFKKIIPGRENAQLIYVRFYFFIYQKDVFHRFFL